MRIGPWALNDITRKLGDIINPEKPPSSPAQPPSDFSTPPKVQPPKVPPSTPALPQPPAYKPPRHDPESVSHRLEVLTEANTPLMRQARTQGLQAANNRGLLNSSMAVAAAQQAAYNAALPIAGQEASQAAQRGLLTQTGMQRLAEIKAEGDSATKLAIGQMQLDAADREKASAMLVNFGNQYATQVAAINGNTEIPAAARAKMIEHLNTVRNSDFALVEQMFGVQLTWSGR